MQSFYFSRSNLSQVQNVVGRSLWHAIVLLAVSCCMAQSPAPSSSTILGAPFQQRQFSVQPHGHNESYPRISNGYLVQYGRQRLGGGNKVVYATSLSSGQTSVLPLHLDGAGQIQFEHVAMKATGHALIAGSYVRASDAATTVNFVAEVDLNRNLIGTYNLGNYTPERVCGAPDGTFWTFGQVWPLENQEQGDYAMLRQYTASGTLKASYFQRSTLPAAMVLNYHNVGGPSVSYASLQCGSASVGLFIAGFPPNSFWAEVDYTSGEVQLWDLKLPHYVIPNGVVLMTKNTAYATFRPGVTSLGVPGLYALQPPTTSTGAATWQFVSATGTPPDTLMGGDGSSLVYSVTSLEPTATGIALSWSNLANH